MNCVRNRDQRRDLARDVINSVVHPRTGGMQDQKVSGNDPGNMLSKCSIRTDQCILFPTPTRKFAASFAVRLAPQWLQQKA